MGLLVLGKDESKRAAVCAERDVDPLAAVVDAGDVVEPDDNLIAGLGALKLLGENQTAVIAEVKGPKFFAGHLAPAQVHGGASRGVPGILGVPIFKFSIGLYPKPQRSAASTDGVSARELAPR